jgi:hypothetical protein
MPSNYEAFYVTKRSANGVKTHVAGATVKAYDADLSAAISTLTADGTGLIVAGTLAVSAGTRVRFRVENEAGLAGSLTQITT